MMIIPTCDTYDRWKFKSEQEWANSHVEAGTYNGAHESLTEAVGSRSKLTKYTL